MVIIKGTSQAEAHGETESDNDSLPDLVNSNHKHTFSDQFRRHNTTTLTSLHISDQLLRYVLVPIV